MATVVAIGGLIFQGVSHLEQARKEEQAGKRAKALAEDNANFARMETEQEVKHLKKEQDYQQSLARAKMAASGIIGESPDLYLEDLKTSGIEEIEWIQAVGRSRVRQALAGGSSAAAQATASMWGNIGQAGSSFAGAASRYNTNRSA